jgi:hypothetical protein
MTLRIPKTKIVKIPVTIPDSIQLGLAANATGNVWASDFSIPAKGENLIGVGVYAEIYGSDSDYEAKLKVDDYDSGNNIVSLTTSNTDPFNARQYAETFDLSNFTKNGSLDISLDITTASANPAATVDLFGVSVVLIYRI